YERFRLRTIGIVGCVAIEFLVGVPNGQSGLLIVTGFSDALHLLIFGHYVEAMIRTLMIHLELWGASVALVGCGDNSRKLTRMLGGAIGIEIRRDLCLRHNQVLKRAIDVVFSIPIALLVSPIIVVLAFAIKLVDPGPAIYVQERVGRNSRTLRMLKLRTMYA